MLSNNTSGQYSVFVSQEKFEELVFSCGKLNFFSVSFCTRATGVPSAAIDLFGGKVATTLEEGMALHGAVTEGAFLDVLEEGRVELAARLTGPARVGTLGFCMGGGYALLGACHRPFDFAVDFYGRIDRVEEVKGLRFRLIEFNKDEVPDFGKAFAVATWFAIRFAATISTPLS